MPGFGNLGPDVVWRAGGTGYGCGGHGLGSLVIGSGGGGGGYSGGGFGGVSGRGGGGGSFVNPMAKEKSFSDQGTDPTPDHGWITYQVTLNQPPGAKCKAATISLNGNGMATLYPLYINNGSSDPDGSITTWSLSKTNFDCDDLGPQQVTMTVTDNIGSTATCNATVMVADPIAPTARCKNITVELNEDGVATITGADVDDGSTDNCSIASMTVVPNSFNCSNTNGPVSVTLTVTDASGNSSTCTALVSVQDNVAPEALCQNITVQLDASGDASIMPGDIDNGSNDACGIASLSVSPSSFTCADVGNNTVTLTVTDNNGNVSTCTSEVTVEDNVVPEALCKNITIQLDANGDASIVPGDIDNGSNDACGIASLSVSPSTFSCAGVGVKTVTLIVTDNNGNVSTCTSAVTVEDNVPPEALCKNITIQLDANGNTSITGADIDNGSNDACGIASMTPSQTLFTCTDVGANTVTLTVTDNNGNSSSCNSTVTVEDNVPPEALCQNITVQLDASGNASITGADIDNGSNDACGIASLTPSQTVFTCAEVGTNTVTLIVTDNNGNTSTCTSTVIVEDNVPPEAVCKNITVQLDASGTASITGTDIDNGSNDACGISSYIASKTVFTCADLGPNSVTLTVTDINGNSSTCSSTVTVEDNIAPLVRTKDIEVILEKDGAAIITPDMINNGSTDNCMIESMWLSGLVQYDCGSTGVHEVTLYVQDQSGNVDSNTANVTVKFYVPDFKNKHNVDNGDTIHRVDCQVPWDISRYDLNYETINNYAQLTTHVYKESVPDNAPWGMYAIWRYEYVVKDACYHTYTFNYYVALYDLDPPIYQNFPNDTTVATSSDVPPVDMYVKIIDVCQYVVWDTVMTMPVLDSDRGDTLGYNRRWMAKDPSGHKSFRDQMIWLGSGNLKQYSMITGRIGDENHILTSRFHGEAGTNGIPVSLYHLNEDMGSRTWVSSWTTGDWLGSQGTYHFVPEHPGSYQVKIDTSICLVDTLKFDKELWSDTLIVAAGEMLDQGWIITHDCVGSYVELNDEVRVFESIAESSKVNQDLTKSNTEWHVYPNPASRYLHLDVNSDQVLYYQLYDALGRSVKSGVYFKHQTIDIRGLNSGLYHFQLRGEKVILGMKRVLLISDF